jgi:hypothetical protein
MLENGKQYPKAVSKIDIAVSPTGLKRWMISELDEVG